MKNIRRVLATCALLGLTVVGLTGCGMNSSADKDILRVGAIGFASTLEPTEIGRAHV